MPHDWDQATRSASVQRMVFAASLVIQSLPATNHHARAEIDLPSEELKVVTMAEPRADRDGPAQ